MRCFRGDRAALTALRLRRIVSFLRRHRLYDTAHALEGQTGAFFDAAHFRRLLRGLRWAEASSYALGFVAVGDCSREADLLIIRILILRVMADLAAGRARAGDDLFQRLYASVDAYPDAHHLRRILLSMSSDRARASSLYHRLRPMAVDAILKLADKCPELKAKARLPRCTSDPAYAMSLGPGLWGYKAPQKNKAGRIPADVLARSFMRKRHLISHKMTYSGVPGSPVSEALLPTPPSPIKIDSVSSTANTAQRCIGMRLRPCLVRLNSIECTVEKCIGNRKSRERARCSMECLLVELVESEGTKQGLIEGVARSSVLQSYVRENDLIR